MGEHAAAAGTSRLRRTAFAATLAVAMGLGPFALSAVAAVAPVLVPELGLSRTQLGSLATLAFAVAAVTSGVAGRRVDRVGGRPVLYWVFLLGGAAAAAMAAARSIGWLWAGAVLSGVTLSLANPVTNQLIADHVPQGQQGLQIGLKQSGPPLAQTLIGFVLPALTLRVGWRFSILVGTALAAAGAVGTWLAIPRSTIPFARETGAKTAPVEPAVWWLTGYAFLAGVIIQSVLVYAPLYAFERVGLSAPIAGMAMGVIGGAGMVARVVWGRMAERTEGLLESLGALSGLALVSVLLILAGEHVGAWALWAGLAGFGASALASSAVVMVAVLRGAGTRETGRLSGLVGGGLFLGSMTGPVPFGAIVDTTDSYTAAWSVVVVSCLLQLLITAAWMAQQGRAVRPLVKEPT